MQCKGAKVERCKMLNKAGGMAAACGRVCLEVGTAPRAVLEDYRVQITEYGLR